VKLNLGRATGIAAPLVIALLATIGTGVAAAYSLEPGTYAGIATPPQYGAHPFPLSFHFNGKKISDLQIGPLTANCLVQPGSTNVTARFSKITFKTVKTHGAPGFLVAGFVLRGKHWKQSGEYAPNTLLPNISIDMVYKTGHPPTFVSNGGSEPGLAIVLRANVVNGIATLSDTGTATCNLAPPGFNPTVKRK